MSRFKNYWSCDVTSGSRGGSKGRGGGITSAEGMSFPGRSGHSPAFPGFAIGVYGNAPLENFENLTHRNGDFLRF